MLRRIGRIFVILLALVGALSIGLIVAAGFGAKHFAEKTKPLPERAILTLDLSGGVADAPSPSPFARLSRSEAYVLRDIVEGIDRAAADKRVVGLFVRAGDVRIGMARTQEIRDAVGRFRKTGKPAFVFSESIGEGEAGTVEYYLASAFDQIWLQPSGGVGVTGFSAETPFFKGALDKLEVKARFERRHEYKNAVEVFTETGFTQPFRESLQSMLGSWFEQVTKGIAETRRLDPAEVTRLIDRAPLLAKEALEAKLVDKLGYWHDAQQAVKDAAKGGELLDLHPYLARSDKKETGEKIALVHVNGAIVSGKGESGPFAQGSSAGADTIAKALRDAAADTDVKAILLRIDSPGGSYTASDTIWHEVERAKAKGKPVIASFGNTAASGGYFVAMGATKILAEPGTVTGSIGVFSGKFVTADLWKKLGITFDSVDVGANAAIWSATRDFTPEGMARLSRALDTIYADFTEKAGAGRKLAPDQIDKIARGRIFTGDQAMRAGLIDGIGGYAAALVEARRAAGIAPDQPTQLVPFPKPKKPIEAILEAIEEGKIPFGTEDLEGESRLAKALGPLFGLARTHDPRNGPLIMPPIHWK